MIRHYRPCIELLWISKHILLIADFWQCVDVSAQLAGLHSGVTMNYMKTAVLLAGMTALFLAIGFMLGGQTGMVIALLVAAGTNVFAYWNSDKAVLSMHGAEPASERA